MGSYIIEFAFHIIIAYVLVVTYNLGLYGKAIVTSLDYFIRSLVLQLFIYHSRFQPALISILDI